MAARHITPTTPKMREMKADTRREECKPPTVLPGTTLPPAPVAPDADFKLAMPPRHGDAAFTALRQSMKKEFKMVFGASYQVSSGATGVTNQVIYNDLVSALSEFTNMGTLFTEFFINKFEVVYQPASKYQKDPTFTVTSVNDVPLVIADLQHGQTPFSNHASACSSGNLLITNSADPWKFTWRNTEKKKAGVLPIATTSTSVSPTQGWCLTNTDNASLYTGGLQILSPAALPNANVNYLYGTVVVRWDISFRSRA